MEILDSLCGRTDRARTGFLGSQHNGRVNVIVGSKTDLGKPVEGLVLSMQLPNTTAHADLTANFGTVDLDIKKRICKWDGKGLWGVECTLAVIGTGGP
eukprot:894803-Prorocentrum_minimum.AAC.1